MALRKVNQPTNARKQQDLEESIKNSARKMMNREKTPSNLRGEGEGEGEEASTTAWLVAFPSAAALEFRISSPSSREGRNSGGSGWERCLPASLSPIYAAALLRRGVERRREGERQQVGGRAAHGGAWGPQVSQAARLLIAAVRVLMDG